jgi:hypothetical protein
MRIYLSSTYNDLTEHRSAVAHVLRQMGHDVVGMEEYVAEGGRPLERCLDDVDKSDIYVGIFAWRYGYVPITSPPAPPGGSSTPPLSITEAELRRATPKRPIVFLLDPKASWPTHFIDAITGDNENGVRIRSLREDLSQNFLAGFFTTPEDLARQVSAAVHRREVRDRMEKIELTLESGFSESLMYGGPIADSTMHAMQASLRAAPNLAALKLNLKSGQYWWSTRLFFLATVAEDLTGTRSIIFVDDDGRFIGTTSPATLRDRLLRTSDVLRKFDVECRTLTVQHHDLAGALDQRGQLWDRTIPRQVEDGIRAFVSKSSLKGWLGADLIERGVDQQGEELTAPFLQQAMAWPHPLVPVTSGSKLKMVVDRGALADLLARIFVQDLAASAG